MEAFADVFRACSADIGFAVGWSRLIPGSVLKVPPHGIVGFHPAALPRNRGRHPIIWSIVLGLERTASTFFQMDEGADSGPILSQEQIEISSEETAGSLYEKLIQTIPNQISEIVRAILKGSMQPVPQDHSQATSWRKRGRADGLIDWRMSSKQIDRLIRALTPPYPYAEMEVDGEIYLVKSARPLSTNEQDAEPGKILDVSRDGILIKTGDGALLIMDTYPELTLQKGGYL